MVRGRKAGVPWDRKCGPVTSRPPVGPACARVGLGLLALCRLQEEDRKVRPQEGPQPRFAEWVQPAPSPRQGGLFWAHSHKLTPAHPCLLNGLDLCAPQGWERPQAQTQGSQQFLPWRGRDLARQSGHAWRGWPLLFAARSPLPGGGGAGRPPAQWQC